MTRSDKVPPPIPPSPPPIPSSIIPATPAAPYQPAPPPVGISKAHLAIAFGVAAVSDVISIFTEWIPPIEWAVDLVTALLLFMILGWHWILLPVMIAEAIPGLAMMPFWVLVVGSIAVTGTVKRIPTINKPR